MKPSLQLCVANIGIDVGELASRLDKPPAVLVMDLAQVEPASEAEAVVEVLARALAGSVETFAGSHLQAAARWAKGTLRGGSMLLAALMEIDEHALAVFLARVVAEVPEAIALAISGTLMFSAERTGAMMRAIAHDPRANVREHLFALLGTHRRLVPPGSLRPPRMPEDVLDAILQRGMTDEVHTVRQRAIAYAYGVGAVERMRDVVVAATRDPDVDVRQYALVALGVLGDEGSLRILRDALCSGSVPETTSAIWALARRKDGIADVTALGEDQRAWVRDEVRHALHELVERPRRGLAERGPDGQITAIVRAQSVDGAKRG